MGANVAPTEGLYKLSGPRQRKSGGSACKWDKQVATNHTAQRFAATAGGRRTAVCGCSTDKTTPIKGRYPVGDTLGYWKPVQDVSSAQYEAAEDQR